LPISLFPFLVLTLTLSHRSPSIKFSKAPGADLALSEEEQRHAAEAQCLGIEVQQREAVEMQRQVEEELRKWAEGAKD
jgi:hypothetical protein